MRSGTYAIYDNEEYEVGQADSGKYKLRSYDPGSQQKGFQHHPSGCFIKFVAPEEIKSAYDVRYKTKIDGLEFPVFKEEDQRLLIGSGTHGPDVIEKYGFEHVDRFEWEKWIDKDAVDDLYEVKVPMWGFPAR